MEKQVQVTIPYTARYRLGLDDIPGEGSIQYIDLERSDWKAYRMEPVKKQMFSLGQKIKGYRVSSQGQVTVPKYILEDLQIQNKDELWVDFDADNDRLTLVKSYVYQFRDVLLSLKPNFFEDLDNELITISGLKNSGENSERFLSVELSTFHRLRRLFHRIKDRYEPESKNNRVGISELGDQGLTIELIGSKEKPYEIVITKLGAQYLGHPLVARLWNERIPFYMDQTKLVYTENRQIQEHSVTPGLHRDVMKVFNHNAKELGGYYDAHGNWVDTAHFYTGDMAIFRNPGSRVEFLPKRP